MCIQYRLISFIAFFPVAHWVAGFFFVVFVLFCFDFLNSEICPILFPVH